MNTHNQNHLAKARRYKPALTPMPYKELMDRRWVDSYDLCALFRMDRNTLRNWCKARLLRHISLGRKKLFDMWEIDQMMEARKAGSNHMPST
ncbi:MAG: helix-turn-helix domain-containing protein [Rhizobacter sp.]|nr:helix-turn-helix domain-containing protein [Ferruginibacter sp.]